MTSRLSVILDRTRRSQSTPSDQESISIKNYKNQILVELDPESSSG